MTTYARVSEAAAPLHERLHKAQESLDMANSHLFMKQSELQVQHCCLKSILCDLLHRERRFGRIHMQESSRAGGPLMHAIYKVQP